ncbi:hypothetical protein BN159_6592 [Streptomyces davaonensis JCM 4913]|uniref:Uncharacterized protein n=1 Tax=Streptomyces davaonensis (strain DSM 101723 / JCM 4913 / KCC S-0913 / 768) TaxID=1214101 RepID=K4R3X6_STRDJ|nr:hypothetical protein [Streptomyces davaonensis]CCK30971.1 hypothetical protein BN159_6592 [Streptomyces davaonensis JCM 4913]
MDFVLLSGEVTPTLQGNASDSGDGLGSDSVDNLFEAVFVRADLGDYSSFLGPEMVEAQAALYGAYQEALAQMPEVLRGEWRGFQKDGDGFLVLWPSKRMSLVVAKFVAAFQDTLAKKNVGREPAKLLRVRLSVVTGLAADSALGTAGEGAVEAKRLVDCQQAKWLQREFTEQQLVVIVSQYVYEQTVRGGWAAGVDPASFQPVQVLDKHKKKRGAYLTAPGRTAEEVRRTVNSSLFAWLRRRVGRTVAPRVRRIVRAVKWTPKLVLASLAAPALAALTAAALVGSLTFSWSHGGAGTVDASVWAAETASPAPERPGPATSRSEVGRPSLNVPSATAADERGAVGNVGEGSVLVADGTGVRLVDDREGAGRTWRWSPVSGGRLRLTTGSAQALTLDPGTGRVSLDAYAALPAQQWWAVPVPGGRGSFRLHNGARPDDCLTARDDGLGPRMEGCRPGDRTQEWTAG